MAGVAPFCFCDEKIPLGRMRTYNTRADHQRGVWKYSSDEKQD